MRAGVGSGGRNLNRIRLARFHWRKDIRGEALPVIILFMAVLITIFLGIHMVIVGMARSAVQTAADAGVSAAQAAGPGLRESEGILAARLAIAGAQASIIETDLPAVIVEPERGSVTVVAYGGIISPLLGGMEFTAQSCGPLDDVRASDLTSADAWRC